MAHPRVDAAAAPGPRPLRAGASRLTIGDRLRGHRLTPVALAVVAGLLAAFAQPPWGFLPGLLGYGLMFRVVDAAEGPRALRAAFFRGWLAGFAYFIVSLWWIAQPFQVDAREQGWMAPMADPVVSAFMALFWGAATVAYRALAGRGVLRALLFAAALSGFEWLRGHLLTGFPWDLPGETWKAGTAMSQAASVVGAYGLTWLTLALVCLLAVEAEGRKGRIAAIFAVAAGLGLYGFGAARLARIPTRPIAGAPWVRVVQPDVAQSSKYDASMFASIVERYVALTARPAPHRPDVVVWPEGAVPAAFEDYLAVGAWPRAAIAGALQPGQTLILGGYRFAVDARGRPVTFNSLAALRPEAGGDLTVEAIYDKYRLVPFGEFMPLDGLASLIGLKQMVHVGDGFTPGPRPRPLQLAGLPLVQPLICYEALFPGFTRAGARLSGKRAAWIVNISNDAWFGTASGPRQHFNMASYRAIENGLPLVRATPTGVSAIVDAAGRTVPGERLDEGAFGVIDAPLPPAMPPTPYDRFGDWLFFALLALSLIGAGRRRPGTVQP
jgi:apolipoprotein N-acyltransferase